MLTQFFIFELGWTIFFSQHIGLANANLILLWFWFVFRVEHYFGLYMDCIEVYLDFNHNYNLVFCKTKEKIIIYIYIYIYIYILSELVSQPV